MTREQIMAASLGELEERRAQLLACEGEDFDVEEAEAVAARMAELQREGRARRALEAEARAAIDSGAATQVETGAPAAPSSGEERFDASSPEYRTAWLKDLAHGVGMRGFDTEMTDAERRAFTFMTSNSDPIVPTQTQNRIVELVEASATIFSDLTVDGFANVYEVPRHKSIDAGDAKVTNENTANDDEQDTFDTITLTGEEIRKHLRVSRKMQVQSVQAFEDWVVRHLASRMAVAKDKYVISQLTDGTYGMLSKNKVQTSKAGAVSDSDVLGVIALLSTGGEGGGECRIYANNKTIWTRLAEVKDANGRPIYKEAAQANEAMRIHGLSVRKDDNLADDVIMVGYPKLVGANSFDPMSVMSDVDVKTREATIAAYELFDCAVEVPSAWAQLTVKSA